MRKILFIILLLVSINLVIAAQMDSSNYQMYSIVVDNAGDNITSTNYQTNFVLGTIAKDIGSSIYNMFLGFWYTSNLVPEIISHTFSPDPVFTSNDLTSTVEWSDNESDSITASFNWYVNHINIYNGTHAVSHGTNATHTLAETYFDNSDTVTVSIRLNDSSSVSAYSNYSITISVTDPSGPATGGSGGGGGGLSYNPLNYTIIPRIVDLNIVPLDKKIVSFKIQNYENESLFVDIGIKSYHEVKQVEDIDIYEIQPLSSRIIGLEVTGGSKTDITTELRIDVHLVERYKATMDVFKINLNTIACYDLSTSTDNPAKCCSGILRKGKCISEIELRQTSPNWKNIIFGTITALIFLAIIILALYHSDNKGEKLMDKLTRTFKEIIRKN